MTERENMEPAKALLVGVAYGVDDQHEEHLTELKLLVETFGLETVATVRCTLRKYDARTLIGKGKLEEIAEQLADSSADVVIIDHEMSPGQQRNLEKYFNCPVMERTEVVLGVFSQRAQTREAQLQVELAEVRYQAPRLKRMWSHLSRQAGTGGAGKYLKGEGEKQIEIDKRLLQKRIDRLTAELKEVRAHRETQRGARQRSSTPVFALVGYTNAGKSTLLNALTDAEVLVEDKLFATLDTTTRKHLLDDGQQVIVIDTVGFIRKLPHQLVEAFKSTLEEAVEADFLLHVIDASHPTALEQAATTVEVLHELGAGDRPTIAVLNKCDRPEAAANVQKLRLTYPHSVQISAKTGLGFEQLDQEMLQMISQQRKRLDLRVPQSDYAVVSQLLRVGTVLQQDYEDNDVLLTVELPPDEAGRLEKYQVSD